MTDESHWDIWDQEHRGESELRNRITKERSADKLAASIKGALGAGVPKPVEHGSGGSTVHVSTKADFKRAAPVKGEKDRADSMRTKIRMASYNRNKRGEDVNDAVDAHTPKTEQKVNPHEGGAARSADKLVKARDERPAKTASPSDEQKAAHYRMVADRAQNLSRGASTAEQHHAAAVQQRRAAELAPTGALRAGHGKIADNHAQSELVERRAEAAKASADAQQRADRAARSAEQQRESEESRARLAARQTGTLERQGGAQAGSNWHVLSERAEIATGRADKTPTHENHQAASDAHMAAANAARGIDDQASMHHQDMAGRHQVVVDAKGRSQSTGRVGSMGASRAESQPRPKA